MGIRELFDRERWVLPKEESCVAPPDIWSNKGVLSRGISDARYGPHAARAPDVDQLDILCVYADC